MRVVTWNIQNGGGPRIPGIARALSEVDADVCVLSEFTNSSSIRLITELNNHGFDHILHSEPEGRLGGVLVAARVPIEPGNIASCPSPDRWLHAIVSDSEIEIGAAYIPNAERSRIEKATYWEWLIEVGEMLVNRKVMICGDFNTGMPFIDEEGKSLACAALMRDMTNASWTDLWRTSHPDRRQYSWWSNFGNGFRLDHALGSPSVTAAFVKAEYVEKLNDQCIVHPSRVDDGCGSKGLSDHSMLIVDLI